MEAHRPLEAAPRGFHSLQATFNAALSANPDAVVTGDYLFGGRPVIMRVMGKALARHLMAPFAHLVAASPLEADTVLRIDAWDAGAIGTPCPPDAFDARADAEFTNEDQTLRTYASGRYVEYDHPGSISWLDRDSQLIVYCSTDANRLSLEERSKPLQLLLQAWYSDLGVHIVHAGLVAQDGRAVLIGGPTGSGKTTASLACALGGFDFLGDDHIGLEPSESGTFTGYSLYGCARVFERHLEQFPVLDYGLQGRSLPNEKALLMLSQVPAAHLTRSTQVAAIILPAVGAARTALRPVSKRDVLLQVAPSSVKMSLGSGIAGFERLAELVRQVPGYQLDIGTDVESIAPLVQRALAAIA